MNLVKQLRILMQVTAPFGDFAGLVGDAVENGHAQDTP